MATAQGIHGCTYMMQMGLTSTSQVNQGSLERKPLEVGASLLAQRR